MNASFASRSRAAASQRLGLGQLALEPGALEGAGALVGRGGPDGRLDVAGAGDDRQVARRPGGVERLGRELAVQRPRSREPLERRPERLERRRRAPAARRPASRATPRPAAWPSPARCAGRRRGRSAPTTWRSVARSRSPAAGQRATMSRSGSRRPVRDGGPQRLRHERHDRMQQPQVRVERLDERPPGRLAHLGRERLVGQPDLGELQAPVAELVPDRVVQQRGSPRRRRSRPWRASTAATVAAARDRIQRSAGPRWRGVGQPALGAVGRSTPGRAPTTKRVAFQSLLAKFRAFSSLAAPNRWSWPGAAPWISAKRRASAPVSSITPSGSTTLPFVLDIFLPSGSRISPDR